MEYISFSFVVAVAIIIKKYDAWHLMWASFCLVVAPLIYEHILLVGLLLPHSPGFVVHDAQKRSANDDPRMLRAKRKAKSTLNREIKMRRREQIKMNWSVEETLPQSHCHRVGFGLSLDGVFAFIGTGGTVENNFENEKVPWPISKSLRIIFLIVKLRLILIPIYVECFDEIEILKKFVI